MTGDCIVVTRFAPDQPGFLDFSYRIKALAKTYRVTVFSAQRLTQAELLFDEVDYLVIPQPEGRLGWLLYMIACARLIRARRPSCVVLLHSLLAPMAWLTGRIPTALYWNEHPSRFTASPSTHPYVKRLARKLALKWLFFEAARRTTLVMPIGEAHQADLLENGCDPDRVRLIYMGVDAAFTLAKPPASPVGSDSPPDPESPLRLIYVGTVNQARGRDLMLEAMMLANREKTIAHLRIVGADPEQLAYCIDLAQRLGIADAVEICGRIEGSAIPSLLQTADAGLCLWEDRPWWRFNPPTKLFEYLAAGLPVLASDIRTHTQYIAHNYNGMIFNYDSHSLAQVIRDLSQRRSLLHDMKDRARERGRQYLWDKLEPGFLQALRSLHVQVDPCNKESNAGFEDSLVLLEDAQTDLH